MQLQLLFCEFMCTKLANQQSIVGRINFDKHFIVRVFCGFVRFFFKLLFIKNNFVTNVVTKKLEHMIIKQVLV